ncbi:hypothetical protein [Mycolicibacterium sp. J2]|uniref:hypothetical protein n=1 Tax=Mycolicibacterium sp. J2 TaxID=2993511 RepID=UPI00224B886E|nr:hypothetical protein [Mycolicibacterium sp. J2]MCX2714211.1 hypothetical protein [Mycolicibacterium sp. J2]
MSFSVVYTRGDKLGHDDYDDSHDVVVKDSGVLEVIKDGDQVKLYSPHFWAYVEPGEPSTSSRKAWVLP